MQEDKKTGAKYSWACTLFSIRNKNILHNGLWIFTSKSLTLIVWARISGLFYKWLDISQVKKNKLFSAIPDERSNCQPSGPVTCFPSQGFVRMVKYLVLETQTAHRLSKVAVRELEKRSRRLRKWAWVFHWLFVDIWILTDNWVQPRMEFFPKQKHESPQKSRVFH